MKKLLLSLSFIILHFYAFTQPQGNRGMYFDGVDNFTTIPSLGILSNTTIELWIKPSAPSNGSIISNMGFTDAEFGYSIDFNSSTRKISFSLGRDGNRTILTSDATLNLHQWYHIAYTFDGTNMILYINGVEDKSGVGGQLPNSTLPFRMGDFNGFKYTGQIDELRIFNNVRAQAQIAVDKDNITNQSAQGFWRFEEGTGQTMANTGTNGAINDGTLGSTASPDTNDPLWALRVKNIADSGSESLRDVITNANTLSGKNYIDFSMGAGPQTISIISLLPAITDAVILDGTSKEDYVLFSEMIKIDNGGSVTNGLNFSGANASNSIMRGLQITNFGTSSSGVSVNSNANNIEIINNLISGNQSTNITVSSANGTVIKGNRIGTDLAGNAVLGTNIRGITLSTGATNTVIGGAGVGEGNLISGHASGGTHNGIRIQGGNNSIIYGNLIGTNANRTAFLPNSTGIAIADGQNNIIGGLAVGQENIIAGNSSGIAYTGGVVLGNTYIGNEIYCNSSQQMTLSGGNNNQAPPSIILANSLGNISGTGVVGDVIHLYKNPSGACNASSIQQYLGTTTVIAGGTWSMSGLPLLVGDVIVGTQTNASNGSSGYSTAFTVTIPNTFFTLGDTNWNNTANWSSDGIAPCGCKPENINNAIITIRAGHKATLSSNANLGTNNTINIQDAGSTFEVGGNISTSIQTLNGQVGTRILMRVFTFPPITNNNYATTAGTTVEFSVNTAGTIPNQFGGVNYKSLAINGSGGAKNVGGNIVVEEDFFLLGGDIFQVGAGSFTVNGLTTIAPSSMLIDNATGGINTFNGVINNDGVLSATGAGTNTSSFNFNNDINNSPTGTLNLDCNCQYNFNKTAAPPLLLQPGGQMIFGSNGGGSGNIFSDLTIGDGALVTFNVTNAAQLLIANDKIVNNNNFTSGVSLNGNGGINGANANSRWVQGNNAQLYYNSDVPIMNTGIFDATGPNTVFYSRGGDQVIKGTTYHSIVFGGSGIRNVTTGNFTINTNFTVPSNITFQINGNSFTANGAVTIVGTFNDSASGGTNTFNDIVQVNSGATFAVVGANTTGFIFKGNITNQGTFNLISSTQWVFDADLTIQNQSVSPMTFADTNSGLGTVNGNVMIADFAGGGNVVLNANGGITLNGSITNLLGDYPTASRYLRITHLNSSGTITNVTNAVIDYRSDQPSTANFNLLAFNNLFVYSFGNVPIKSTTYHHLKIIGTGNKTLAGDITVNGNLEIGVGASLNTTASNHNIDIKRDWMVGGTFVPNNSAVIFSGTVLQSITTNGLAPFNNMVINNLNHVQLNTATQANSISLSQGRLVLGNFDFTLAASPATNQIVQGFTNTSTSYIETDGVGRLIRNDLALATPYVFPIGDATSIRHLNVIPTTAGNMAAKFDASIVPAPSASFTDVAVGSWSLSGGQGSVTFFNSGCVNTNSKVYRLNIGVWDATGITTTVALPDYTATALNFVALERYTILGTDPLVINPSTLPSGQVGMSYLQTPFSVVTSLPPVIFSLNSGTLPDGLSLDVDKLTGFPTTSGTFVFTIGAIDNGGNTGERTYTLVIDKGLQFVQTYSNTLLPDGKYELTATFDSGLPASFLSTNKNVATIQGNTLTIMPQVFDGETDILVFQEGNNNFKASDSVVVMRINNFGLVNNIKDDAKKYIEVYPNPVADKLLVKNKNAAKPIQNIALKNINGNDVNAPIEVFDDMIFINTKNLESGMYILHIKNSTDIIHYKIVKL